MSDGAVLRARHPRFTGDLDHLRRLTEVAETPIHSNPLTAPAIGAAQ